MGMPVGFSRGCVNSVSPNPNPFKFKVLKNLVINGCSILLVDYPGCRTFNGEKLLLLRREWKEGTPNGGHAGNLDPHLLGSHHIVLARFEPNELGWKLAIISALSI